MNKKKAILTAVVLALILLIGSMLAYFTDFETKTNEFTLGDGVDIKLTETFNEEDAKGLHPGAVIDKAPTVENNSTTTSAFVFVEVIVPCSTANAPLFTLNNIGSGWTKISSNETVDSDSNITYVYAWGGSDSMTSLAKKGSTGDSTTPVFTSVTLDPDLKIENKPTGSQNIVVNAYGIQTDKLGENTTPTQIYNLVNPAN